jgi:hypothetical protein
MTPPPIDLQRRVCRAHCATLGLPLITPDAPQVVREAVALTAAAVSPRTLAEVRAGTSFYVPRLAGALWQLLPDAVEAPLRAVGVDLHTSGAVHLSAPAWDRSPCGTVAHECSHGERDKVVSAGGVIVSALWGVGYLAHPTICGWEEGTCRTNDLVALVVFDGLPVDDALKAAAAGVDAYALSESGREVYLSALESAAASLRAGQLPGVGTHVHQLARLLVAEGWDAGPWAAAIGSGA